MNQIDVDIQQTTQEIGINVETGSGIISVAHDNTLTGSGTLSSPLGVDISLFATAEQGSKADTAVQPSELATVATTGKYSDLLNTPSLATVATSGSYNDLSNKPTIPTTASDVDALAITGGTATGTIEAPAFRVVKSGNTFYYIDTASTYYLRIGTGTSISGDDLLIRTGTNRFLSFGNGNGGSLGSSGAKWGILYSLKINNGEDITVPSAAGTIALQTASIPTASASNEGLIYQYVGTTDNNYTNGYFYKCVSDGQSEPTYSWEAVKVQADSGGGDYLPLTGGTLTGDLTLATPNESITLLPYVVSKTSGGGCIRGTYNTGVGMSAFASNRLIVFSGHGNMSIKDFAVMDIQNNFFCPVVDNTSTLGHEQRKWANTYTAKINNGSDINVPNTAGTMVVATPPTTDGTYVLKATVLNGEVTYSWVLES